MGTPWWHLIVLQLISTTKAKVVATKYPILHQQTSFFGNLQSLKAALMSIFSHAETGRK